MVKKNPVNLNPSSLADVTLAKLSVKERGKAMANGEMPDDWDFENITNALRKFEHLHPGLIDRIGADVDREVRASGITKHAMLSNDSAFQKGFWLPVGMMDWMEMAYPTFWANERHARWFMRKFSIFSYEYHAHRIKT